MPKIPISVGIVGYNGREMTKAFLRMSQGTANCYHITSEQPLGPKVNVLVAAEASPVLTAIIPELGRDDYLVVNADDKTIFPLLSQSEAKLITYGFNARACITASSVTDDGLQVCIQRTFCGIDGAERMPQEFPARGQENSTAVLGAAAAWAVLNPSQ
ncbi:MAG: hypothetical protein FWB91_06320 [Defluviitaleaceae bacterium]|nr:hypothetical protein [Defluviitaleaceae bacterium]